MVQATVTYKFDYAGVVVERRQGTVVAKIVIHVEGGVPYVYSDQEVDVLIVDYDIEAVDEDEIKEDSNHMPCFLRRDWAVRPEMVETTFVHFESE
jgi:hypothetical protein